MKLYRLLVDHMKKILLAILSIGLVACGNDSGRLSDDELRAKVQECDYAVGLTAVELQVCENYHRECKRRLKEGRFVCN